MKLILVFSVLLLPVAFASVIRIHQLKPSFRFIYDKNQVNTFASGPANLKVKYTDESIIISSSVGSIEIKNENKSFVVESVPGVDEIAINETFLESKESEDKISPEDPKENEKYDIENDKLKATDAPTTLAPVTEAPIKFNCMDSPLKDLIIKCEGNIRLREFTEEERLKSEEQQKRFEQELHNRMNQLLNRMGDFHKAFEKNIGGIFGRSSFKFDRSFEPKVDNNDTKVDNNDTKVDNNDTKVDNNDTKVDNNDTKVDNNDTKKIN